MFRHYFMDVKFIDTDIVDINLKVAEQCLIKANVEENDERKIKSIIFAKNSIDNALKSYGVDIDNLKITQGSLPSRKMNRKFKSVVKATDN